MKFALLLALIILNGCTSAEDINDKFIEQYGREVKELNSGRIQPKEEIQKFSTAIGATRDWRDSSDIIGVSGTNSYRSATFDTSTLTIKDREEFLPNQSIFEAGMQSNFRPKLPDDMFDLYYVRNYPPFKNQGIDFDLIQVPKKDAYNVSTELSDKQYLLIGNNVLQRNLDLINPSYSKENNEISKILAKEKREEKRKKRSAAIFGDEKKSELKSNLKIEAKTEVK